MTLQQREPWDWFSADGLRPPAEVGSPELGRYLNAVEDRLHRQALMLEGMRELLQDAGLFREDQLMAKVQEIDLRDGAADGRIGGQRQPQVCGNCGRSLSENHVRCIFCGSRELLAAGH